MGHCRGYLLPLLDGNLHLQALLPPSCKISRAKDRSRITMVSQDLSSDFSA